MMDAFKESEDYTPTRVSEVSGAPYWFVLVNFPLVVSRWWSLWFLQGLKDDSIFFLSCCIFILTLQKTQWGCADNEQSPCSSPPLNLWKRFVLCKRLVQLETQRILALSQSMRLIYLRQILDTFSLMHHSRRKAVPLCGAAFTLLKAYFFSY